MPKERQYLAGKPEKEDLLIKRQRGNPETIGTATKTMKRGETRKGFLGEGNITRKPDHVVAEALAPEGVTRKRLIQNLLAKWIEPNQLGSRSTALMDKRSLVSKLKNRTLEELEQLLPDSVLVLTTSQLQDIDKGESDISEEQKTEIQEMYKDRSP